jgi:hypothetical protein
MTEWTPTSEDRFHDMLGQLPPEAYGHGGFLVGEPCTHRTCRVTGTVRPTFSPFIRIGEVAYEGTRSLTVPEFRALDLSAVVIVPAA